MAIFYLKNTPFFLKFPLPKAQNPLFGTAKRGSADIF
jgi:hypothetical protein